MAIASIESLPGEYKTNGFGPYDMEALQFRVNKFTINETGNQLNITTEEQSIFLYSNGTPFIFNDYYAVSGIILEVDIASVNVTELNISLVEFFDIISDGDVDELNFAFWGGNDKIGGDEGNDYIRGYTGSDTIFGDSGEDLLRGDAGADKLYGGDGIDSLIGGSGNDRLFGDAGDDRLAGGTGSDQLVGGQGYDILRGGSGADRFIWRKTGDFGRIDSGDLYHLDFIADFSRSDLDKIDISQVDANSIIIGNQAFIFISSSDFRDRAPGRARAVELGGGLNLVEFNTDNDASAEFSLLVSTHRGQGFALQASDFVL